MPSFEKLYLFLKEYYLHSRFEGSENCKDFPSYSQDVTRSSMEQLSLNGIGFISRFESRLGREIIFDVNLNIINKDEPPAQICASKSNLTHILG